MQTDIHLEFADGQYRCHLGLAQINLLQEKCGVGIGGLYARVFRGRYLLGEEAIGLAADSEFRSEDLIEVIRQGLIGGGKGEVDGQPVEVSPLAANRLIAGYVYPARPLSEAWSLAAAILSACIDGYEPAKKAEPAKAPATKTTAGSTTRKRSSTAR